MFIDIKMDSQRVDAVEMHEHETKGASEGDVSSKKTKRVRRKMKGKSPQVNEKFHLVPI